jgi:DNA-binding transcriptional ArsR family regulator
MAEREEEVAKRQLQLPIGKKVPEDTFQPQSEREEAGAFNRNSGVRPNGRIDSIEASLKSDMVCSNINRVAILHVLKSSPRKEMQAEKLAHIIGVSHRTVLYHLDILEDYELVQVCGFRKKGQKMLRSVWGLKLDNGHTERIFRSMGKKFPPEEMARRIRSIRCAR